MIKVFVIDGVLMPHIVEWDVDQDSMFEAMQKFCETDVIKPATRIASAGEWANNNWELTFWCDEDACIKPSPQRTLMLPNRWGGAQVFFNKIVAAAQDINGDYIDIEGTIEVELNRRINVGLLHFEVKV